MTATKIPVKEVTAEQRRDIHLHLDWVSDKKLRDIKNKIWNDQHRGGEPTDIEGVRYAIAATHKHMFSTK